MKKSAVGYKAATNFFRFSRGEKSEGNVNKRDEYCWNATITVILVQMHLIQIHSKWYFKKIRPKNAHKHGESCPSIHS